MKRLAWMALCCLALGANAALAERPSHSYSTWIISGNLVTVRFLLPVGDARRLTGAGFRY